MSNNISKCLDLVAIFFFVEWLIKIPFLRALPYRYCYNREKENCPAAHCESGVYAAGSTSALMKGKSYNRGHKALFRSVLPSHVGCFYSLVRVTSHEKIPEEPALRKIVDCVRVVESDKESAQESVRKITTDLKKITDLLVIFKSENQERSKLFAFWDEYCSMVSKGKENRKLEVASFQYCSNVTSIFCHGQAELPTCLSRRYAETGTNSPGGL